MIGRIHQTRNTRAVVLILQIDITGRRYTTTIKTWTILFDPAVDLGSLTGVQSAGCPLMLFDAYHLIKFSGCTKQTIRFEVRHCLRRNSES